MESFLEALFIVTKTTISIGLLILITLLLGQLIIYLDNYIQTKYYKEKNKEYEFIKELVLIDFEDKISLDSLKFDLESQMLSEYYNRGYENKHIKYLSKSDILLAPSIPLSIILKLELYFDKRKGWLFAYDMHEDGYHIIITINFPNIYIHKDKEYLVSSEELDIIKRR